MRRGVTVASSRRDLSSRPRRAFDRPIVAGVVQNPLLQFQQPGPGSDRPPSISDPRQTVLTHAHRKLTNFEIAVYEFATAIADGQEPLICLAAPATRRTAPSRRSRS